MGFRSPPVQSVEQLSRKAKQQPRNARGRFIKHKTKQAPDQQVLTRQELDQMFERHLNTTLLDDDFGARVFTDEEIHKTRSEYHDVVSLKDLDETAIIECQQRLDAGLDKFTDWGVSSRPVYGFTDELQQLATEESKAPVYPSLHPGTIKAAQKHYVEKLSGKLEALDTAEGWAEKGRQIKTEAVGAKMHSSDIKLFGGTKQTASANIYDISDTEPIPGEEQNIHKRPPASDPWATTSVDPPYDPSDHSAMSYVASAILQARLNPRNEHRDTKLMYLLPNTIREPLDDESVDSETPNGAYYQDKGIGILSTATHKLKTKTMLHELAHLVDDSSINRLGQFTEEDAAAADPLPYDGHEHPKTELIADLVALSLGREFGTDENDEMNIIEYLFTNIDTHIAFYDPRNCEQEDLDYLDKWGVQMWRDPDVIGRWRNAHNKIAAMLRDVGRQEEASVEEPQTVINREQAQIVYGEIFDDY